MFRIFRTWRKGKGSVPKSLHKRAPSSTGRAVREFGGPSGVEPTRYGDWERKGRCIDF